MKTIEEIIRSYKNSISLEPYGLKEFQRHPELQEQINMYQSLVKTTCVALNNLWESYNEIRNERIEKLKDAISRCTYAREIEHFDDGTFRLHFVRTYVPEDYEEIPDCSLSAQEKYSDASIYLLVDNTLYRVYNCGGYLLTELSGRSIQLTEEEAFALRNNGIIPERIAKWKNFEALKNVK